MLGLFRGVIIFIFIDIGLLLFRIQLHFFILVIVVISLVMIKHFLIQFLEIIYVVLHFLYMPVQL